MADPTLSSFRPTGRACGHPITRDGPAPDFFDGALLGNGGLGAVVTTRPDAIVVHFGHNSVWDIRIAEEHADEIGTFAEVLRRAAEIPASYERLDDDPWFSAYRQLMEMNYARPYPRPFPCGSLILGFTRRRVELLGHELGIVDGVCRIRLLVEGRPASVEIFVDQSTDRLWLHYLDPDGRPGPAPFDRIRLLPDPDGLREHLSGSSSAAEAAIALTIAGEAREDPRVDVPEDVPEDCISFRYLLPASLDLAAAHPDDRAFRLTARTLSRLETVDRPNWYGHRERMPRLERALPVSTPLVACVQLDHGRATEVDATVGVVPLPSERNYQAAAAASARLWHDYWERSGVALGDATLERTWYRNTYFMHCAIRAGSTCPGIFGNWSYREVGTAWHGDYHMNYNTQQVFWGVFSSNRVEQHLPYVDLVDRMRPLARKWARDYYGMRGANFPHSAYPVSMNIMPNPAPPWSWQISETPWTVQSLWWHYLCTKDVAFLQQRGLPPIREASLFLIDYVTRPDARGVRWGDDRWHIFPTVVPELYGLAPGFRLNSDCLVDLTLIRFVLNAYLEACDVLGLQDSDRETMTAARDVLEHLPEYSSAETPAGAVLVSVPGEDPDIVYNVPIPGMTVFPGEQHGLHSPPEVYELVARSHRRQQLEGGNELVFANLQAARLGLLDLERFKRQISYCELPNGTCTDMLLQVNGRYSDATPYGYMAGMGIFVENFALTAVVNECLLQSYTGTLRFFPNWPPDLSAEFRTLRTVGAFIVSAQMKSGDVQWIEIFSEAGGPLRVIVPWESGARCARDTGERMISAGEAEIATDVGDWIRLTRAV